LLLTSSTCRSGDELHSAGHAAAASPAPPNEKFQLHYWNVVQMFNTQVHCIAGITAGPMLLLYHLLIPTKDCCFCNVATIHLGLMQPHVCGSCYTQAKYM
jgi:hypothetical protein